MLMPDPNMAKAYQIAKAIGRQPRWYKKYRKGITPQQVALAVHVLDFPLIHGKLIKEKDPFVALNVLLRWWSGCISMAKVIALSTRDGRNTPKQRKRWAKQILSMMKKDIIFADGVHAAITLKRIRKQDWSFEGFDNADFNKIVNKRDVM